MCGCLTPRGKRSRLIQECITRLPHPREASDKLIPQISPPRKKFLFLQHHIHTNRCSQPTASLLAPKKRNEVSFGPKTDSQSNGTVQLNVFRSGCADPWRLCPVGAQD